MTKPVALTVSEVFTQRTRAVSPSATAGLGFPAPECMSSRMLMDQLQSLNGRLIVYTCRARESDSAWETYAGVVRCMDDGSYKVKCSEAFNSLPGVVFWDGEELEFSIPDPGFEYSRLMDAAAFMAEQVSRVSADGSVHVEQASQRVQQAEAMAMAAQGREREAQGRLQAHLAAATSRGAACVPSTLTGMSSFADVTDVRVWQHELREAGCRHIVTDLDLSFRASGVRASEMQDTFFRMLRAWLLTCESMSSWVENEHFVSLGNGLLSNLKISFYSNGLVTNRGELLRRVASTQEVCPIKSAYAGLYERARARGSKGVASKVNYRGARGSKGGYKGNGGAGKQ